MADVVGEDVTSQETYPATLSNRTCIGDSTTTTEDHGDYGNGDIRGISRNGHETDLLNLDRAMASQLEESANKLEDSKYQYDTIGSMENSYASDSAIFSAGYQPGVDSAGNTHNDICDASTASLTSPLTPNETFDPFGPLTTSGDCVTSAATGGLLSQQPTSIPDSNGTHGSATQQLISLEPDLILDKQDPVMNDCHNELNRYGDIQHSEDLRVDNNQTASQRTRAENEPHENADETSSVEMVSPLADRHLNEWFSSDPEDGTDVEIRREQAIVSKEEDHFNNDASHVIPDIGNQSLNEIEQKKSSTGYDVNVEQDNVESVETNPASISSEILEPIVAENKINTDIGDNLRNIASAKECEVKSPLQDDATVHQSPKTESLETKTLATNQRMKKVTSRKDNAKESPSKTSDRSDREKPEQQIDQREARLAKQTSTPRRTPSSGMKSPSKIPSAHRPREHGASDSGIENEDNKKTLSSDAIRKTPNQQPSQKPKVSASPRATPIENGSKRTTPTRKSTPQSINTPSIGPTPNTKAVKSRIGSMANSSHTPGGGNVKIFSKKDDYSKVSSRCGSKDNTKHKAGGGDKKIESQKLEWKVESKVGSMDNARHKPTGGDKKVETQKLEWKVTSKIGSMDNARHKAGGGDKKVETQKLDFKSKAQSKVGSKDNIVHKPGGGDKKIETQAVNFRENAQSKCGSKANIKHKAGGGEHKIESHAVNFRDNAQSKCGSKDNIKHKAGGGEAKIETHAVNFKDNAQSKCGSKDNIKHKAGGGEAKIESHKLNFKDSAAARTDSGT